jgi:hypothetical protein
MSKYSVSVTTPIERSPVLQPEGIDFALLFLGGPVTADAIRQVREETESVSAYSCFLHIFKNRRNLC